MGLNEVAKKCHQIADEHGFYADYERVRGRLHDPEDLRFLEQIWLSNRLMLIVSELAEALEGVRDGNMSCAPKSGGLGEELADAQIRLMDLFHHRIVDMEKTVTEKMAFNESRPFKHNRGL